MGSENPFQKLQNGFAITIGNQLLPGAAGYPVGAIATVFSSKQEALRFTYRHHEDISTLGLGEAGFAHVGDPYTFMRRAAADGLAGITFGDKGGDAHFMFMVRVEEAGQALPSVLTSKTGEGWGPSLTRTGIRELRHAELLHWQRFDILDQVSGKWGERCPFRDWDHGETLYEISAPGRLVLLGEVPLLGDWNSTEGAVPFFTNEDSAWHYLRHHHGRGAIAEMGFPVEGGRPGAEPEPLRAVPVHDLRARLAELREIAPFAAWCVNPDAHRENAAIGRLWDAPLDGGDPPMRAVSGLWRIKHANNFELAEPLAPWSGRDTIRWSGGTALQLHPLDRSFVGTSPDKELTETEVEEVVEARLRADGLEVLWNRMYALAELDDGRRLNLFHLVSWDTVTGDGVEFPGRFEDFFGALQYLATFERFHDRVHRATGAVTCQHVGFWGSGDEETEELRSARFQLGLKRLGMRVLQNGYQPAYADDLVALCNGTLRTLHVEYAGFPIDLLWSSPEAEFSADAHIDQYTPDADKPTGQRYQILDQLELDPEVWTTSVAHLDTPIDSEGERLALARMSRKQWQSLEPRVRHFVSTGLFHLDQQGHAPMLDYAPISLEIVKALEVELGAVFEAFRESVDEAPSAKTDDHAELALGSFLTGGKPPTLGAMSHLLRVPRDSASPLALRLHQFVSGLSNAEDLTSSKFLKRGLQRVVQKYRNGGVHDSPIPEEVCRECVEVLVGSLDEPGYLPTVAAWKLSPRS